MTSLNKKRPSVAGYQRIEADLRSRITGGHWSLGAMLPSRRDLAREYTVSGATMERAIAPLIADGTLRSDDRRGTFVARQASYKPADPIEIGSGLVWRPAPSADSRTKQLAIGVIATLYLHDQEHLEHNNFWVGLILRSMERSISEDGKTSVFFNRARDNGKPPVPLCEMIASALSEGVQALAIIAFDLVPSVVDDALGILGQHHVPVVCVLAGELTRPVPHVFYDNSSAGYQAAQHLIVQGHRHITVMAPFNAPWVRERILGIQNAIDHAGSQRPTLDVRFNSSRTWVHEEDPETIGYQAARLAIERGDDIGGALICMNDGIAFGVLRAMSESGKKVGEDFAMVGFDDHENARALRLTTLSPPMEAMGQEAARLLLMEIHGEPVNTQVRLRAHLIPRESTRPASVFAGA